jgi:hypothetical protein
LCGFDNISCSIIIAVSALHFVGNEMMVKNKKVKIKSLKGKLENFKNSLLLVILLGMLGGLYW